MSTEVEWGKYLGKGSYGSVYLGFKIGCKEKRPFAIKVFDLKKDTTVEQCISLLKEFRVMEQIPRHDRVIECFECGFDERGKVCMLLEYMAGGTLGHFLRASKEKLSESKSASCIKQIVEGVAHLHAQGVFHRDLKGDNILIVRPPAAGQPPHIKLADFGSSKLKTETMATLQSIDLTPKAGTAVGTALWMAPEVMTSAQMGVSYDPAKADIWSVGIVSCEVLQKGTVPWGNFENACQALFVVAQWKGGSDKKSLPPGSPTKNDVSSVCYDFLRKCLTPKAKKRPKANELLTHSFLADIEVPKVNPVTVMELEKRDRQVDAKTRLVPCSNPRTLQKLCQEYGIADGSTKQYYSAAEPSFMKTNDFSTVSGTFSPPLESETDEDSDDEIIEEEEEEAEYSEDDDGIFVAEEEDTHTKQTDEEDQSTHVDDDESTLEDETSDLSEDEEEEEQEDSDEEYESQDVSFCTNLEPAPVLSYGPPPPPERRSQPFTPLSSSQQHSQPKAGTQWVPAPASPAGSITQEATTPRFGAGRGARRPAASPTLHSDIDSSSSSITSPPGILKPIGVINLSPSGNTLKLNYNKHRHMDPTPPPGTVNRLVSRYEYFNTDEYYPNKGSV